MFETKTGLMRFDLQLFADGSGGEGGTGAADRAGETAAAAVPQTRAEKRNPLTNVKYGIQPEETEVQVADAQQTFTDVGNERLKLIDRKAEFEKLIKGDYKDLYDQRVQETVKNRLKSTKEVADKFEALAPTLEILGKKYGIDASDPEALNKAIQDDDAYYEEEALETGMSVQQIKEIRRMERENAALKEQMRQQDAKENANRLYAKWFAEAEETKQVYPAFDLDTELANPVFRGLLREPTLSVRTAYEAAHINEILPAAMQFTANKVEQKLANKIIANGARPTENGMSAQSAAVIKSDVSQLSKADRKEIARRVARGERITF